MVAATAAVVAVAAAIEFAPFSRREAIPLRAFCFSAPTAPTRLEGTRTKTDIDIPAPGRNCLRMKFSRHPVWRHAWIWVCGALLLAAAGVTRAAVTETARGLLLVCNKGEHTLSLVDVEAGKQIAAVDEEGVTGHEVIASPDGRFAYVPIYGNSGVGHPGSDGQLLRVIDLNRREIVQTLDFGKGVRPHCAQIGPKDGLLYITTELLNAVTVVDPRTLKIVGTIPTGQGESHMLAISHDGQRGYTSNVGPGTVSVLDLERRELHKIISVGGGAQRICVTRDDRWVFTADQSQPRLALLDAASASLKQWVELPGIGYSMATTPDGRGLVVTLPRANLVGLLDLTTLQITRTVSVPPTPQMVVVRPDGGEAYISCDASRQVAVLNLAEWKVTRLIDVGRGADGLAWAPRQ